MAPSFSTPSVRRPAIDAGPEATGVLATFNPISLEEMDSVALLERRDTKYVLSTPCFLGCLTQLSASYRILEVNGTRLHAYRTVYFDSDNFDLYRAHHNNRPIRYKVRSRTYIDSDLSFFEVKTRDARQRTVKARTSTGSLVTEMADAEVAFLETHAPYPTGDLAPRLVNLFQRITLVDLHRRERLTFDLDLRFRSDCRRAALPGVVVAELKQPRASSSPFKELMRRLNVHPSSFSKYCTGASLLYPGVKHNRFNPQLRLARRITGECDVQ